jgi:endonuclease/exonuclease/phosphatase (EEP) superfamily protein YafD
MRYSSAVIKQTTSWGSALLAGVLAGCTHTTNLLNPSTPGFFGSYAEASASYAEASPSAGPGATEVRIVTFNIKLGRAVDRAVQVLSGDSLRGADVIALQEMDEVGVERIARAMRLNYAYYPGSIHPTDNRYFGPALLSRWPIERSWKLLLPHEGKFRRQRRTATAAVLRIGSARVLAYAIHLEPQIKISESDRRDQVLTIVRDAAKFDGPVVLAGDFNSEGIGPVLVDQGYRWASSRVGPSITIFAWDHIFVRGLVPERAGLVRRVRGASDHKPVWVVARTPVPAQLGSVGE